MSEKGQGVAIPFVLKPGGYLKPLPLPGGALWGEATAINDNGDIVGYAVFGQRVKHAVVWWHVVGKNMLRFSTQMVTRSLNRLAPGPIVIALLAGGTLAPSSIDVRTLTLGNGDGTDVSITRNSDGSPAVSSRDVNRDGLIDLMVSFDGKAVLSNEIPKGASSAELLLLGMLKDRSNAIYSSEKLMIISK